VPTATATELGQTRNDSKYFAGNVSLGEPCMWGFIQRTKFGSAPGVAFAKVMFRWIAVGVGSVCDA
jgi:hypothetical protein